MTTHQKLFCASRLAGTRKLEHLYLATDLPKCLKHHLRKELKSFQTTLPKGKLARPMVGANLYNWVEESHVHHAPMLEA